eukprot:g53607.t1
MACTTSSSTCPVRCFLREQKQGGMVVEVPYLIIEGKVRNLRKRRLPDVVEALFRVPEPRFWEWQTWESSTPSSTERQHGCWPSAKERAHRPYRLLASTAARCPRVEFQTCEKRFPETSTRPSHQGKEFSWRAGEVSVMNADGAKAAPSTSSSQDEDVLQMKRIRRSEEADHFMAAPLVNSFEVLVRFGQEKWSRDVGARPSVAQERIIKEALSWFSHIVHALTLLNRSWPRPSVSARGTAAWWRSSPTSMFLSLRCHFALLSALSRCGTSTADLCCPRVSSGAKFNNINFCKGRAGPDKVNIVNL